MKDASIRVAAGASRSSSMGPALPRLELKSIAKMWHFFWRGARFKLERCRGFFLALMALVNVKNVRVLDNPTLFTNQFQFEVTPRPPSSPAFSSERLGPFPPRPPLPPLCLRRTCHLRFARWNSSAWASWRTTLNGKSPTPLKPLVRLSIT